MDLAARMLSGEDHAKKLKSIPLSKVLIADNLKLKLKALLHSSSNLKYSLQLGQSTDVEDMSHLLCFVRFIVDNTLYEEYLFCSPLKASSNVINQEFHFFDLKWANCIGVCTLMRNAKLANSEI